MERRLFREFAERQGLSSESRALKRFEKFNDIIERENISTLVVVVDNRYVPVVYLRQHQTHMMLMFSQNKIGVIG